MLRTDMLQMDLRINGDESRKQLAELKDQAAELRKEMKGIKDQELLGKKQQELDKLDSQMEDIRHTIGITGMTMKELAERSKSLGAILRNIDPNTEEFKAYKQELDQVNARHAELRKGAQAVNQDMKQSMSGFSLAGIVAGGMAAYNVVASVFSGIKDGIVSSIEAYRQQEIAIQKVEQAIKQTGGSAGLSLKQLTDEATRLQNTTLFGDEEILNSATAQLLTFTNIAGENFLKAQVAAMDLSTVLDGDLKSSSIQLGKALSDPVAGLTALRKVGVTFTEDQRKMIKELAETNRLEEAQALILKTINEQYGGQAEAVAKGTGALKAAGIQLGEIAESFGGFMGKLISPVASLIGEYAKRLNELITPSKTALETFEEHGRSVAVLVKDIDPLLDRYDQLKSKTALNASEQNELKKIIGQVAAVMPGAATAFDQYGNAIEISSQRVRDYIKGQVLLLRYENRKAIDETIADLADVNVAIDQAKPTMNTIATTGTFQVFEPQSNMGAKTGGTGADVRSANAAEIAETLRRNQELINTQAALNTKLSQLRGDALQQSLSSYAAENNAAKDAASELVSYKAMSMDELKRIAEDEGTDTQKKQAKEEIKIREELKKNGEEYARYMLKIAENLENARVQSIQDGRDRELKIEELAYRKKLSEIKGNTDQENQLRMALEEAYSTKVSGINQKYNDKEKEESLKLEKEKWQAKLKGLIDGSMEWFNIQQQLLALQRDAELSNVELTEQQRKDIEDKYRSLRENLVEKPDNTNYQANLDSRLNAEWEAEKMMLERTGQMTIDKKREIAAQERDMALAAAEGNSEQQMVIWEQYYEALKKINAEWVGDAINGLTSLINSFSAFDSALSAYEQAQLQMDEANNNAKKDNLKKRLDSGLISQQEYDAGISKMDKEMAAKKRKIAHDEAVRQKAISLVQAIINTAQGIVAALTVPYVGIALAVVAGIMGAAQIALIASTPIPAAAKGRYNVIGQDDKKSYRDVPYEESYTGIPGRPLLINETGDEVVIDPETTKRLQREAPYVIETIKKARRGELSTGNTTGQILADESGDKIVISPETLTYLKQNAPEVIDVINRAAQTEAGIQDKVSPSPVINLHESSGSIDANDQVPPAAGESPVIIQSEPVINLPEPSGSIDANDQVPPAPGETKVIIQSEPVINLPEPSGSIDARDQLSPAPGESPVIITTEPVINLPEPDVSIDANDQAPPAPGASPVIIQSEPVINLPESSGSIDANDQVPPAPGESPVIIQSSPVVNLPEPSGSIDANDQVPPAPGESPVITFPEIPSERIRIILPDIRAMRFNTELINAITGISQRRGVTETVREIKNEPTQIVVNTDNSELKAAIDLLNATIRKGIKSSITYDNLEQESQLINDIRSDSTR